MASKNFQERFKDSYSTIPQDGVININPERAVIKPTQSQLHSTIIKSSGNSIVQSSIISPVPKDNSDSSFYASASIALTGSVASSLSKNLYETINVLPKRSYNQSAFPIRNNDPGPLKKRESSTKIFKKNIEYKPYTLKDYNIIKPKDYFQLGGLGPSNIGTDD